MLEHVSEYLLDGAKGDQPHVQHPLQLRGQDLQRDHQADVQRLGRQPVADLPHALLAQVLQFAPNRLDTPPGVLTHVPDLAQAVLGDQQPGLHVRVQELADVAPGAFLRLANQAA